MLDDLYRIVSFFINILCSNQYLFRLNTQINIYQMMCDILGLEAKPNNGSRDTYEDMFAEEETGVASRLNCYVTTVIASVVLATLIMKL